MDRAETTVLRETTLKALDGIRREHDLCWRDMITQLVTVLSFVIQNYDLECPDRDSKLK